jgi:hypothetical protein
MAGVVEPAAAALKVHCGGALPPSSRASQAAVHACLSTQQLPVPVLLPELLCMLQLPVDVWQAVGRQDATMCPHLATCLAA